MTVLRGLESLMFIILVDWAICGKAAEKRSSAGHTNSARLFKRQANSYIHMQQSSYRFPLTKCSPGSLVGKVAAADVRGSAVYYILETPNNDVAINQKTGQLLLINFISPNREYSVVIRAASNSGSSFANVTFGCGSFSPVPAPVATPMAFSQPSFSFTTRDCTTGSIVGSFINSNGLTCSYSAVSPDAHYQVLPGGEIRLATPTTSTQTMLVRANCGQTSGVATATISSLCPVYPVFSQPTYSFTANACTPGQTVGTVAASNSMVYVIDPANPFFTVTPTTGVLRTTGVLTGASYTLTVRAYSSGQATSAVVVQVNAPRCLSSAELKFFAESYSFSPVNCSMNAFIGQIGTLGGSGTTTTYSVDNPTGVYSVGFYTGAITAVGNPTAGTLTIRATNGETAVTVPVSVSLDACDAFSTVRMMNTGGPVFGQRTYAMTAASCADGTAVGQVFATSPTDSNVTYSIDSGRGGIQLKIDSTSGVISLDGPMEHPAKALVVAMDSEGRDNSARLTVKCNSASPMNASFNSGVKLGFSGVVTTPVDEPDFVPPGVDFG